MRIRSQPGCQSSSHSVGRQTRERLCDNRAIRHLCARRLISHCSTLSGKQRTHRCIGFSAVPLAAKVRAFSSPRSQDFPVAVIDVPAPASRNQGQAYQNRILELVEALSPRIAISYCPATGCSRRAMRPRSPDRSRQMHPLWFDEPCSHANLEAVRKSLGRNGDASRIRRRHPTTPAFFRLCCAKVWWISSDPISPSSASAEPGA